MSCRWATGPPEVRAIRYKDPYELAQLKAKYFNKRFWCAVRNFLEGLFGSGLARADEHGRVMQKMSIYEKTFMHTTLLVTYYLYIVLIMPLLRGFVKIKSLKSLQSR